MSVQTLKTQTGIAPAPQSTKPLTVNDFLVKYKDHIASALPKHMNADRMVRIVMTEIRKTPKLGKCTPESLMSSVIILSQLGLEPGVNGQAFLVPYDDKKKGVSICTAVPGWQGYVDLISRAGRATVHTDAVRPDDVFDYTKGTSPYIKHIPGDEDDAPFTHVYAVGRVRNSEYPLFEVWSRKKVSAHLKRYNKVGDRHYALANENNFEMYGRKIALLQVIKYLPKSVEMQNANSLEQMSEVGQTIGITEAVAGTFQPSGYIDAEISDEDRATENPWSAEADKLFDELKVPTSQREVMYGNCGSDDAELIDYLQQQLSRE